ncbi:Hypothetical protein SCLAV_0818, partial [Streptomyces clavuligerus]
GPFADHDHLPFPRGDRPRTEGRGGGRHLTAVLRAPRAWVGRLVTPRRTAEWPAPSVPPRGAGQIDGTDGAKTTTAL